MDIQFLATYASIHGLNSATEAEAAIVNTLYAVARDVAPKFRFGYLDIDDVVQQAVYFGLQAISDGSYQVEKPLENFLRYHMRNRMHNYKRDTFSRTGSPCPCCSTEYPPDRPCEVFAKWVKRNADKKSLTSSNSAGLDYETRDSETQDEAIFAELIAKIDDVLPMEYRADYLRMRDGVPVAKARRNRIRELVKGVAADAPQEDD